MIFCRSQTPAGVSLLTRHFGIRGYATSVHTACASGGQAVGTGMKLIRRGTVDWVAGRRLRFDDHADRTCRILPPAARYRPTTTTPERASRPFDATRNGFVLGEGAGFLVLEEWEAARRRGAHIYAELAGDGNSLQQLPHHRLASVRRRPDPVDASGAGRRGRVAGDVDYVNAHGTSTMMNDRSESAAMHAVFGDTTCSDVAVSSTKSAMGHLIAAAGAVEVGDLRAGDPPRHAAGQRQLAQSRIPTATSNLVVAPTSGA